MKEWVANHYCGKGIGRKLTFIRLVSFDVRRSQIWQDFGLLHVIVLVYEQLVLSSDDFLTFHPSGERNWLLIRILVQINHFFLTGINTLRHSYTRNLYFYLMCTTVIEDQTEAEKVFMPVIFIILNKPL